MSYNLIDAAKDLITGNLKFAAEPTILDRHQICDQCEAKIDIVNVCSVCGCIIAVKAQLLDSKCPLDKW
jgi:hypothetical protein